MRLSLIVKAVLALLLWVAVAPCSCAALSVDAPIQLLSGQVMLPHRHAISNAASAEVSPIAYYSLDEISGSRSDCIGSFTLYDTNNFTYSQAGIITNAALFNYAAKSSLVCTNSAFVFTSSRSIDCWANMDTITNFHTIVEKSGEYRIWYNSDIGRYVFQVSTDGTNYTSVTNSAAISAGSWYYIRASYAADIQTIALNVNEGTSAQAILSTNAYEGTAPIHIGGTGTAFMSGAIDEIGFWNGVMSTNLGAIRYNSGSGYQICSLGTGSADDLNSGVAAYWTMDEASGSRADCAGSYTLSDSNTVTSAAGVISNSAAFTYANHESLYTASDIPEIEGTNSFTISTWLYLADISNWHRLLRRSGAMSVTSQNAPLVYSLVSSATNVVTITGPNLSQTTWYHCLFWRDSANQIIGLRVNGGTPLFASFPYAEVLTPPAGTEFFFGDPSSSYMGGRIDEAAIWNRVLSKGEQDSLYNGGAGLSGCPAFP